MMLYSLVCLPFSDLYKLEEGSVTLGMVTFVQTQGLQVKLPFGGTGTVAITDLSDAYKPNALDAFSKDQLIRSGFLYIPTTLLTIFLLLTQHD